MLRVPLQLRGPHAPLGQVAAQDVPLPRPDSRTGKVVEVDPFPLDVLLDVVEKQHETAGRYAEVTLVLALTGVGSASCAV